MEPGPQSGRVASGITRDEWLSALADVGDSLEDHPEAMTLRELSEMFDLTLGSTTRRMEAMIAAGKAEQIKVRRRYKHWTRVVVAYRLKK